MGVGRFRELSGYIQTDTVEEPGSEPGSQGPQDCLPTAHCIPAAIRDEDSANGKPLPGVPSYPPTHHDQFYGFLLCHVNTQPTEKLYAIVLNV